MMERYTTRQKKNIAEVIGFHYRKSLRQIETIASDGGIISDQNAYEDAIRYVNTVDRALKDCSNETKFIIRNGILIIPEPGWYEEVYSKNTFYRLRKKAIEEFLNCLKH